MRLAWRLLTLLIVLVVVVGTATAVATGWILVRAEPQRTGTLHAAGLTASVTVRRDAHGFANIYASDAHDLFLAEGYIHASERMWQMEILRRAGEGRLAELFGKSQLDTDRLIRTLGWQQAAQRDVAAASPAVRDALAAYSDGVNAWLTENPALSLPFVITGVLRLQGGLDGYRPAPWTPVDSAVFAKTEGWLLAGNFSSELFRFLLAQKVDQQAVAELYAPPDPAFPTIVGGSTARATRPPPARRPRLRGRRPQCQRDPPRSPHRPSSDRTRAPWIGSCRSPMGQARPSADRQRQRPPAWAAAGRTSGPSRHRVRPRASRCWPTTRTSGSRCRRSGTSSGCIAGRSTMPAPTTCRA